MTDNAWFLAYLQRRPGQFVRASEIRAASQRERGCELTVHSRASDLRAQGHSVECRVVRPWDGWSKRHVGRAVSYYRLVVAETERGSAKEDLGSLQPAGHAPSGNPPRSVSATLSEGDPRGKLAPVVGAAAESAADGSSPSLSVPEQPALFDAEVREGDRFVRGYMWEQGLREAEQRRHG